MIHIYEIYSIVFIHIIFITWLSILLFKKNNYQKLLEKPDYYRFDKDYLNNILYSSSPLIETVDIFCRYNNVYKNGAIVSLSGGVDSMVLLAILIYLSKIHNFTIYTASIDYGLRKESNDESKFLKKYTSLFGIKSYISYVKGYSRKQNDSGKRSEFEEESRNIRFNTYKQIIHENNLNPDIGVFVAHHKDDIIENIFTNAMKGANILDLEVMKDVSMIHDVKIYRPLLAFKKDMIYNFAHLYYIPYFLDTTPKWSKRGKMRNNIFPLLDEVFGIDWRNKLKDLGDQSNNWGNYINEYIINEYMKKVKIINKIIIIPIENQPLLIYTNIILKSLHKINENMLRKTSMLKIMDQIKNKKKNIITLDNFRESKIIDNNLIIYNSTKTNLTSLIL
jgi:tRNA(Ile)-lysidine synthetase-like protein